MVIIGLLYLIKKEEVDISIMAEEEDAPEEGRMVSKKYIAEIIEARVEEIFEKVDEELKKIDRSGMLPAGVFLSGGGSYLQGIVEIAKKKLRLPVCVGTNKNIIAVIDKVNDIRYTNALGLVIWGEQFMGEKGIGFWSNPTINKTFETVKRFFAKFNLNKN